MKWDGKTLAEDLAKNRDPAQYMTWVQVPLGSVMWSGGRVPRADVLSIRKSFSCPSFIIYEVKVSRSDFNADVNKGKYRSYFSYCSQLYFAVPAGLVHKEEVPEGTGLIVRGENGWRVVKAAPRREHKLDEELLLKLLMRGYEDRRAEWKQYEQLKNLEYKGLKEASFQHGIKIAQDLGQASELIQKAQEIKEKIGEALGKNYDTAWSAVYSLQADIERLFDQKRFSLEAMQLANVVERLLQGSIFGDGLPEQLRKIADQVEVKFKKEESDVRNTT